MHFRFFSAALLSLTFLVAFAGCGGEDEPVEISGPPPGGDGEEVAPHGGMIVELGHDHKYHAELVDNEETGVLTVYILGADMKELKIDAPEIELTLAAGGKSQSFTLAGSGTQGKHSQYSATDNELIEALDTAGATGKLRVTIDGRPYSGSIEHHEH